jgi:lysophospholipase L1-like esterase
MQARNLRCGLLLLVASGCTTEVGDAGSGEGTAGVGGANLGGAAAGQASSMNGGTTPVVAGASSMSGGSPALTGTAGTGGMPSGGEPAGGAAGVTNQAGAPTGGVGGAGGTTDPPACQMNQQARCSGSSPIKCDFGGGAGDFLVTLELGGALASSTYVEAESYRRMLGNVALAAGEKKRFSFGVNVRQPEGQPIQDVSPGTPGLQLYLRGSAPSLSSVCIEPLQATPKVWIAGDSTVCDQDGTDQAGWGQHLPQHFKAPVSLANYADSGESSSTVLNSSKMWGAIKAGWKAGDWVLVQVGHNDKDVTASTFQSNITAFVSQAKAASVHIILCTPTSRVGYALAAEHHSSTGANLPQIIKDVGKNQNVPVIDLTTLTWNWQQTIDWKQYFALGTDKTHTSPAGAEVIAGLVSDAIRDQQLELAQYIR